MYKRQVKQTKELDDNSQSKNDRKDPKVIAKLVTEGRYSAPYTPDGVYACLLYTSNISGISKICMVK